MKNKKILVTAGGTQEYIDDVRVMTNISTGKLGAKIADELTKAGAQVYYVCGKNSVIPDRWVDLEPYRDNMPIVIPVKTARDALEAMKKTIVKEKIDAVVHSMAVSDFTFKRDKPIKCKSNDPEGLIEYLRQTITMNPKIISHIKEWRPETVLVGFKFEVGISEEELIALAEASIQKNGCDLVIANDKKEMERSKEHIARFVYSERVKQKYNYRNFTAKGKDEIALWVKFFLEEVLCQLPDSIPPVSDRE